MAINGCLLDFCLNGSKVTAAVRPTHYAQTCSNLRTLATRGVQLQQLNRNHVAPVWPLGPPSPPETHLVQAWSTGCTSCGVDGIKHIAAAHSKDTDFEVSSDHNSEHEHIPCVDSEGNQCNNTNTVDADVTLHSNSAEEDTTSAENIMKSQNVKKMRRKKVKGLESHKKRSGRRCPQPDVTQYKADTIAIREVTRDNVQLPAIAPLSEDNTKPTVSWVQNKSVARLRDLTVLTNDVDHQMMPSASMSTPVILTKPCQTSTTTMSTDTGPVTSVSVIPTTKSRRDCASALRKSTRHFGESKHKFTKVFWSEAQTLNQNQLGMSFPGAPPCTPTAELLQHYEYIASMTDIRAQRALRAHLEAIDTINRRRAQRDRETQCKREKVYQKTLQIEAKKKQRLQIYALNKIMTEMEHKLFTEFCKQKGDIS